LGELCGEQLAGREVDWTTVYLFLSASRG
jgi:hypothetical protein